MISSASSPDHTPKVAAPAATNTPAARPAAPASDRISIERAAFLRAELVRQPEVRPEVVARARLLAADPSYPPKAAINWIAHAILTAPDFSEADN